MLGVLLDQGLGHTLSGYGSYLLKPEPLCHGDAQQQELQEPQHPAQKLTQKMDQREAADGLRQNGAHSNGTAPVNGRAGEEHSSAGQQALAASELRSRRQLQVAKVLPQSFCVTKRFAWLQLLLLTL